MPLRLEITDGTRTVELSSSTRIVEGWTPAPPFGEALSVADTVGLYVHQDDMLGPRRVAQEVNRLLDQASRRWSRGRERPANPAISAVYLQARVYDSDGLWRSEVFGGRIIWEAEAVRSWRLGSSAPRAGFSLIVEREPFWEGDLVTLPLTNAGGTRATTATIYNDDDANDNWATIHARDVTGDMPAPARVELAYGNVGPDRIWVAHNATYVPTSYDLDLQGEDGTAGGGVTGATQTSAANSSGEYERFTWTSASQVRVADWALDSTTLQALNGAYVRPILRLNAAHGYSDLKLQIKVVENTAGGNILWESDEWLSVNKQLEVCPLVPLPPRPTGGGADVRFGLFATKGDGGATTYDLDVIYLFPTDAWRILEAIGTEAIDSGATLVDDMIEGRLYEQESGGAEVITFTSRGDEVHLVPGLDQRLLFLFDINEVHTITSTLTLAVKFRPRRSTL